MPKKKSSLFAAALFGGILFLASFPLLFWNEGRSLHRIQTLAEGRDEVIENVSTKKVSPENQHKLVHMTGFADANERLQDPRFNVVVKNVLKLVRTVEMYQWEEHDHGKDKAATYSQRWNERRIDSDRFENLSKRNPEFPFKSKTFIPEVINFGEFRLSDGLVGWIDNYKPLDVGTFFAELPGDMQDSTTVADGGFYVGADPNVPQVGDLRVSFSVAQPTDVSVLSELVGNTFQKYSAKSVNGTIERLEVGQYSAGDLFTMMETENKILTWGLRCGGGFMMFMGAMMILDPVLRLFRFVPIAGQIATSAIALMVALATVGLSVATIAIAWLFYRPIFALGLLAVSIALVYVAQKLWRTKRTKEVVEDARIVVVE